ncbi:unnamed protein product [Fusarium graminearum]|nr:unnamed protein product [Fusarium graminearum]CAG1960195.1 unnamed protein product [Fusarium graminearum]VTO90774.1 unnamed protein product [Fusarium graminearum]
MAQEAKDDKHGHVLAQGCDDGHDEEEDVGYVEDNGSTVDFAERCGDQGAKGETEDVYGDDKGGDVAVGGFELAHNVWDTWCEHGRALAKLEMYCVVLLRFGTYEWSKRVS